MIPAAEVLETLYTDDEVEQLLRLKSILGKMPEAERAHAAREGLRAVWPDEVTHIERTHWIRLKEPGQVALLKFNYAQRRFYREVIEHCRKEKRPIRAIVLKGRQLGFSTFIQAWQYELCNRESNRWALTVSYDDVSSGLLAGKAAFVHRNLWYPRKLRTKNTDVIEFKEPHGSAFHVRTSGNLNVGRGDTYHHLHCSEVPMWSNAEEVLGGLLQSVPAKPGTSIFFESTAKGAVGAFYDEWQKAEAGASDYIPFFAPWFWDPDYVLEFGGPEARAAFERSLDLVERRLLDQHALSLEQLHWRRFKIRNDLQGNEALWRQEYPSTAQEAFITSGSPVFNPDAVSDLERNAKAPQWVGDIFLVHEGVE